MVCGRCGAERHTTTGVCPNYGYAIAIPAGRESPAATAFQNSGDTGPDAPTSPLPSVPGQTEPRDADQDCALADIPATPEESASEPAGIRQRQLKHPSFALLAAGLLSIIAGQLTMSWSGGPGAPALGVTLLILGVGLVAGCAIRSNPSAQWANPQSPVGLATGLALTLILLWRVAAGHGSLWEIALWVAAVAAFGAVFASPRGPGRQALRFGWPAQAGKSVALWAGRLTAAHAGTWLPLLAVIAIYCIVAIPNLTAWRYSFIGDEYLFYEQAGNALENGVAKVFSQEGVYDHHPQLNTIYKAAVMWLFGDGHFGWKMSGVVTMMLTIAGVYALGYVLAGRWTASAAAGFLAASHHLLGLMNGGSNHLEGILIAVWALTFLLLGIRKRDPFWLYLAGAVIGLGFYFHYSARIVGPVALLFAMVAVKPREWLKLWPVLPGFVLAIWPTLLLAQEEIVTRMLAEAVGGYTREVSGPIGERLVNNLSVNLPAFHYNTAAHTYVSGPLLDPITGALAVVGIGLALGSLTSMSSKLFLIWIPVAFFATGLLSPYPSTAIARLYVLTPPLALLAGIAVARLPELLLPRLRRFLPEKLPLPTPAAALAALLTAVLLLNLYQAWYATHRVYHYPSENLAIGALLDHHCDGQLEQSIFVGAHPESSLSVAIGSHYPDVPQSELSIYETWPPEAPLPEPAPRCVILLAPNTPETQTLKAVLLARHPQGEFYTFTTPSRKSAVEYFYLNDAATSQ